VSPSGPAPWTTAQARAVALCDVAAALVVLGAALAARGRDSLADQVVWIDVAILGLLLAVVANGMLFLVGRRAIGQRRRRLRPDVREVRE
jgi:hypothetical protein